MARHARHTARLTKMGQADCMAGSALEHFPIILSQ